MIVTLFAGFLHSKQGRYNAKYRADNSGVGRHLSAASDHGERAGRNGSKVCVQLLSCHHQKYEMECSTAKSL